MIFRNYTILTPLDVKIFYYQFDDDTSEMTEETLFDRHYETLKKLRHDSLIILDNFNVLPKDDSF